MSDLFVVAEAHPYWPSPISRRDDDPFVLVMGIDDPSALAVWVREYDVGGVVIVHRAQVDRQARFMANLASGAARPFRDDGDAPGFGLGSGPRLQGGRSLA